MKPPMQLLCNVDYFYDGQYKSFPIYKEIQYNFDKNDISISDYNDIIIGWCNGEQYKTLKTTEDNSDTVKSVYLLCLNKAKQYIEEYFDEWRLGGNGVIVLVEIFPIELEINGNSHMAEDVIIGFAEVLEVPPRYYFGTLKTSDKNLDKQKFINRLIKKVLKPDTVLVLNNFLFNHCKRSLNTHFSTIMDIDMLANCNTFTQNIYENINTIWDPILTKCENASGVFDIENILLSLMWQQRFHNDSYLKLVEDSYSYEC